MSWIMKNKVPIIIGILTLLVGGTFVALNTGDVVTPVQLEELEFDQADVQFLEENVEFITEIENDEDGVETIGKRIGIRVPIKYDFPVLDELTGNYNIEEIDGAMEMNFDGYNMCRQKGETKLLCLSELRDDVKSNIQTFQENVKRELDELKAIQFQEEIILENI